MLIKMFANNNALHQAPAGFVVISSAQLAQHAADTKRGLATPVRNAVDDATSSFAKRLTDAVQRRVPPRAVRASAVAPPAVATASPDDESQSFAEKLSEATKRAADRRHDSPSKLAENAKRERERYHPPQRRAPSKSD
jgi:short-subunit dehydrogenase